MCKNRQYETDDELTRNDIQTLLSQAKEAGIKQVTIGGGEPLIREDIFRIIELSHKMGFLTSLVSNGTLIDQATAKKLLNNGSLFRLGISMDGIEHTHDEIRAMEGAYQKTLKGLKNLIKVKKDNHSRTFLYINTVISKLNVKQLPKIAELARNLHIGLLCQPVYLNNGDLRDALWINDGGLRELEDAMRLLRSQKNVMNANHLLVDYFKRPLTSEDFTCPIAFQQIGVDAQGNFFNCPHHDRQLANFKTTSIQEFLASEAYQRSIERTRRCHDCLLNCAYTPSRFLKFAAKYFLFEK